MTKYRPLLLILVCVALAALVWMDNGNAWFGGKSEPVTSRAHKEPGVSVVASKEKLDKAAQASESADIAATDQLLSGNPLASFDKSTLQNWVARPVFAPSRKRPPKQTAQKGAKKPPPPDYKLLGVVLNSRRTIALLRSQQSGADFRVQVGDMIGGWHVATVERNSVTLKRDGETAQTVKFAKDCDDADDGKCP